MPKLIKGERCKVRDSASSWDGKEGIAMLVEAEIAQVYFEDGAEIWFQLDSLRRIVDSATDAARDTPMALAELHSIGEKLAALNVKLDEVQTRLIAEAADRAGVPAVIAEGLKYIPVLQALDLPSPLKEVVGPVVAALLLAAKGLGIGEEVFKMVTSD